MNRWGWACLVAAAILGLRGVQADQTWTNSGTGDWAVDLNWSTAVPTGETATVNNGATAQIGGAAATIAQLNNNNGSAVEVNNGGSIRVTGDLWNEGGTLTVNSGGVLEWTGDRLQRGTTIINTGGTMYVGVSGDDSWGRIGNGGFATTYFTINGGTVNAQNTQGDGLALGDFEHTTYFNMTSGGTLNMGGKGIKVGWWKGGTATATVDASAIDFTQDGSIEIGAGNDSVAAMGMLTLQNGATLTKTAGDGGGDFRIGSGWGGKANTGELVVASGATLDWQRGEFQVGNNGANTLGTMTLDGGTVTAHSWTAVSRDGAQGHLIINGGTMNVVGDAGGHMQVTTSDGGRGVVDINGGVLNVTASGGSIAYQHWGQSGESWGTINLNGGRLIAGNIYSARGSNIGHAVFNFNGGVLQPNGGNLLHDIEAAYVRPNGAIIEFTGNSTTINQALLDGGGDGELVVRGNGVLNGNADDENMLSLPNYNNTFKGGIVVSNGAHVRIGTGDGNTGDGPLGAARGILLDYGGLKNNDNSAPILGATRTITLGAGGGYFTVGWGDRNMEVQGKVTGVGGLNVARDGGNLVLSNPANDWQGDTRIGADGPGRWTAGYQAGLYLGASEVIPDGPGKGSLTIDGGYGGHLNLNGCSETINGLSDINGGRIYNSGAAATLSVGNNGTSTTYRGTITDATALRKVGAGTQTLASTARLGMTGETEVREGTLRLAGEMPGSGAIRMSGGTLRLDQELHVTRQAGLVAGSLGRGGMDTVPVNPGNLGVALTTTILNDNVNPWGDNSEYIYSGAFFVGAAQTGEWTFAENVDDSVWLAVDGAVVLNDGAWNTPTRATITLTEGWHNIDVRGQNGNGGFGPSNQGWLTNNLGFVYKLGAGTDVTEDYAKMTDSGDGNFLRTSKNMTLPNAMYLDSNATIQVAEDGHDWAIGGVIDGGGDLSKTGAGRLALLAANTLSGRIDVAEGALALGPSGSFDNSPGVHIVAGATLDLSGSPGFFFKPGQTLSGAGTVTGQTDLGSGSTLAPGSSPGTITFATKLNLFAGSTLALEIAGLTPGTEHDQVVVLGDASLAGDLAVVLTNAFVPAPGNAFTVLTASALSGAFANATNGASVNAGATNLVVHYGPTSTYGTNNVVLVSASDPDEDGDGLRASVDPDDHDPDVDDDLMTDGEEYVAFGNPTSTLSRFTIQSEIRISAGTVIQWNSLNSRLYSLDGSTNLPGGEAFWTQIADNIPGPQGAYTNPPTQPIEHYRLRVRLP